MIFYVFSRKKKSPFPPAVVTLKRNPKASGMARLLRKTVLFLRAKVRIILHPRKEKGKNFQNVLTRLSRKRWRRN